MNCKNNLEQQVEDLFKLIMRRCKAERKSKTQGTLRHLASRLGKTENYLSSIENGRQFPSLKTFLEYLIINGFSTTSLENLTIETPPENASPSLKEKSKLATKIYALDDDQVQFLVEQARIVEYLGIKSKKSK